MFSRAGLGTRWLVMAGCLIATGAQAESFVVRAGNGAVMGPILATDGAGRSEIAMLDLSGDPLKASGERMFQAGFDGARPLGFIEVLTGETGLRHPYAPFVYFDRPNCIGQAFVSLSSTKPDRDVRAAIVGTRSDLFLIDDIGAHLYQVMSRRQGDACVAFDHVIRAFPASNRGSLADSYPPPYVVTAAP